MAASKPARHTPRRRDRELREELNLDGLELSPCVWTRSHVWHWDVRDEWYDQRERFYVARLAEAQPALTLYPDEMLEMDELRWWSLDELAATEVEFSPRRLAALLPPILAGDYPGPPIDTGK